MIKNTPQPFDSDPESLAIARAASEHDVTAAAKGWQPNSDHDKPLTASEVLASRDAYPANVSHLPRARISPRPKFLDQAQDEQHYERIRQQARRDRVNGWLIVAVVALLLAGYCVGLLVSK